MGNFRKRPSVQFGQYGGEVVFHRHTQPSAGAGAFTVREALYYAMRPRISCLLRILPFSPAARVQSIWFPRTLTRHPTKPGRVTVPYHERFDLPKHIIKSIVRQAGLSNAEFFELLDL
jgi:hypothetical protein